MKRNPRETAPKTAWPKSDGCHFLAQVGKSASDQPICCHASSAESTLMFAAAIIAGSSDAVLGHPALHQQMDGAELQL